MIRRIGFALMLFGVMTGWSGCLGQTGRAPSIRQYVLEYPPPFKAERPAAGTTIRVDHFSANRLLSSHAMVYREGIYRRESFPEHRWWVGPADMVAESLRRDLRESGLFQAVLSPRDIEEARYSLEGVLEEFIENRDGGARTALLAVTVTFLDLSRNEASGLVIFQKNYRAESPISEKGAGGLAAAMSTAMSHLSRQIIADIDSALRRG